MKKKNNSKDKFPNSKLKAKFRKQGNGKSKPKSQDDTKASKQMIAGSFNDISWYSRYPELLKIAGVINEFQALGEDINWNEELNLHDPSIGGILMYRPLPGIISLTWIPTPGVAIKPTDAINLCNSKRFTQMRLKNFSLSVYDPADVGFYFLAMDSIFSMYAYLCQVYSHARRHNFVNKYQPRALMETFNVDFNDIIDNLDRLLFYINTVKEKISVIRVPRAMDYIARHMFMSSHVFKDADIDKAQLYTFVPGYLYQYDATVPKLTPVNIGFAPNKLTFAELQNIMDSMLNAVLPDEDMNIIAADIQKFIDSDYWTVNSLSWDDLAEPVYNEAILWQIHNANILSYDTATGLDITQTVTSNLDTIIYWNPEFTSSQAGSAALRVIDSKVNTPSAEEIVESTRFKWQASTQTKVNDEQIRFKLFTCGSEILTNASIIQLNNDGIPFKWEFRPYVRFTTAEVTVDGVLGWKMISSVVSVNNRNMYGHDTQTLFLSAQFNNAPIIYVVSQRLSDDNISVKMPFGNIHNLIPVKKDQLKALNDMCLLSLMDAGS